MPISEDDEREVRVALMRADIVNKEADTAYKTGLLRWEPWKVLALGLGAGAGLMAAAVGLATVMLRAAGGH